MQHLHEDPESHNQQPLLISNSNLEIQQEITLKIMQTPCGHKYHPSCLKQWLEIKLECPSCRKVIPSVD